MARFPNHFITSVCIIGVALLAGSDGRATGLEGSTVTVGVYTTFPGTLTLVSSTPMATVGPSVEIGVGDLVATASHNVIPLSIDFSAAMIDLHYPNGANATPTSFNGYHFDFSGLGADITDVSVDPLSTLNPVGLSSTANSIFVNVQGLGIPAGADIILDVSTAAVPEPDTYELLAGGFGVIGVIAHQRRRSAAGSTGPDAEA